MRAAVLYGPEDLRIQSVEAPVAGAGEVLVRVKATAVCGTDVSIFYGDGLGKTPVIQGHESAGVVEQCGHGVTGFAPEDHVIINPAIFCGRCYYCTHGLSNLCPDGGLLGRDRDGTFAEYVAVPQNALSRMPKSISFEDASTLQALATDLRAWDHLSVGPMDTVTVLGLGTPGLLHIRMAVLSGAGQVFAVTRSGWKLDIAKSYGGRPVNSSEQDPGEVIRRATDGRGADVVIEAAGTPATLDMALDIVRPGGTLMLFGLTGSIPDFNSYAVYYKELKVLGSRAMNTHGYENAIRLFSEGKLDLSPLVTHRFGLEETERHFRLTREQPGKSLRMVCLL